MAVTASIARDHGAPTAALPAVNARGGRTGTALGIALAAAVAYAVFAHGATNSPVEARVQVFLAAIAVVAGAVWLWQGSLRVSAPAGAWAGLGLLAAFAAWSGLSLSWSVAPSATWTELNRAISYVLVFGLALACGSWSPRAAPRAAVAFLVVAVGAALYALGGKIAPGIHFGGFDLNQTSIFPRLRAPLQYWNALAIVSVFAVPVALRLAVNETRDRRARVAGLVALALVLLTIALTYSRGGVVALVVVVAVTLWLAGARLRSLMYLALGAAFVVPALTYALDTSALTGAAVPLSRREDEGLVLGLLLLGGLVALAFAGRAVMAVEARSRPDPLRSRRIGTALVAALGVAALVGFGAMATSNRGLTGTVTHQWKVFRAPKDTTALDPQHLLSSTSGNRWVWWSEALGAWSDHPLLGSGAGSFPILHRRYRTNQLDVLQPHSVPLQLLAETGLVGGLLYGGAVLLLLAAALGGVRRLRPGSERGLDAAVWAGGLVWALHSAYDWDWDIPGVTLPALVFLGILAARPGTRAPGIGGGRTAGISGRGALALAVFTLLMCTIAVSSALPSWAKTTSADALESVSSHPTPKQLRHAVQRVELAGKLDPLSVEPMLTAAAIERRRGRPLQQRAYLLRALRREPDNTQVWIALAAFELTHGQLRNGRIALDRARALDPRNRTAILLLAVQQTFTVPAAASATATGTPLLSIVPVEPLTQPGAQPGLPGSGALGVKSPQ